MTDLELVRICAKVAEGQCRRGPSKNMEDATHNMAIAECAAAIRERKP